jgi:phospholipid N-methyltransferase
MPRADRRTNAHPGLGAEPKPDRAAAPRAVHARSLRFLREFLRDPGRTAAIAPSSPRLAERMLSGLDVGSMRSIVEYGPGTGVFTRAVLERLPAGWVDQCAPVAAPGRRTFIAIEYNPELASLVRSRFPGVCVENESAEHVEAICARHGVGPGQVDLIVSGLGWVAIEPGLCTRMLEATRRMLRPGGEFRTFGYHVGLMMPHAAHFRREIARVFPGVTRTRAVWANLPPAFVYVCRV